MSQGSRPNSQRSILGGPLVGELGARVAQAPAGRVCEEEGCNTRLSVYNPGARCSLHEDPGASKYMRWNQNG